MADDAGYRIRLRVRIGKSFSTKESCLTAVFGGRELTIKSQMTDEPLSETKWIVLGSGGFETEEAATDFGKRLKSIIEVASLCSRLGLDIGTDRATHWFNEEIARSNGLIKVDERVLPNIHGLIIFPDDGKSRFWFMSVRAKVRADQNQFLEALEYLGSTEPIQISTNAIQGVRLLNKALMSVQPLTQLVLAISALESIGQGGSKWSDWQSKALKSIADEVEKESDGHTEERSEIAASIRRGLHKIGLRQGVLRLLRALDLGELGKEWDRIYSLRSAIFHGIEPIPESEIHTLANEAIALCGKVILAMVKNEGLRLPPVTAKHFGDL